MSKNYPNYYKTFILLLLFLSGHNNVFTQSPNYTANDQVTPYDGPFHYGTNLGYYPGWTDGQLGDLAAGNPALNIPGIGATTLRPGLFEYYLEDFGYSVNVPWFEHYESLGLTDHTMFVGYPSEAHRDPSFYCNNSQSTVFRNMYEPIWDGGANGTPVNDDNYYALFLYKMVNLYGPYIKFWEIWNEPDLDFSPNGMGWRPQGDPAGSWWDQNPEPCDIQLAAPIYHYNRLLRISFEVIKSIDPNAYVTVGGLGFPSFLDALMRNTDNPVDGSVTPEYPLKGGAYFDVLSFHSYPHINGSLLIWDPINGVTGYQRHSDAAIRGITEDLNEFKTVLNNYGYDGNTFPEKEVIMTESSVPRKKFGDYIGSEMAALNYAIKLPIELQREGVLHFHYYDLGEKENFDNAIYPFQATGFYEKLAGTPASNIQRTQQGIAYKTVSDLLFEKTYDPIQSAALNLPDHIDGGAFRDSNNQYTYALWAVCQTDDTEESSADYSFPASFNLSNLESRSWDFSLTSQQTIISANNIGLTGSPIFLSASNQEISFTCPTDIEITISPTQSGQTVTWNAPVASTLCANNLINVNQTGGQPSGSFFAVGTSTISYEISDNCGNIETCSFNVIIDEDGTTPVVNCPNDKFKVTINIIGNGSVNIEYIDPASATQTCSEETCSYCVNPNTLLKFVGVPDAGETFLGWSGGGCGGNDVCWKTINWETEITATFSETASPPLQVLATANDVNCNGESNGSIVLQVSGGAPNYSYNWSNGQSSTTLSNAPAGDYVVTVTDSEGASSTASATVNQPTQLLASMSSTANISCIGSSDGTANATASGGTAPYQYLWSNNETTSTINNLESGTYTATITDNKGCSSTTTTTVLEAIATTPVSDFSKTIDGLEVDFSDISTGNPASWLWEYGDGNSSSTSTASYTYSTAGTYLACLTVSNNCGENISCQNISVGQTNNVDIELESISGNAGSIVQVPVRVYNFNNVVSFQHSFRIPDTTIASFIGTSNFISTQLGNPASINVSDEQVNAVWLTGSGAPISVINGTALYYMDILLKGGPDECVEIILNDQNFPTEFVVIDNGSVAQVGYNFSSADVCTAPGVVISGNTQTEVGLPIQNVEIFNNNIFTTTTNLNGIYETQPANGGMDYFIEPHKDINHVNGVTSFDLAVIQQHIVGNALLDSPYKIIAADVDGSNLVTSIDLWLAQQVIIGLADTFPNNESWRFVPADFVFPDATDPLTTPFPEHIELNNVLASMDNQNFVAIKVGDINDTALPNAFDGGSSGVTRSAETEFEFLWQKGKNSQREFYLEFLAKDFQEMSAFQMDLFFEKNKLTFDRIEGSKLNVQYGNKLLQDGVLTLIWYDMEGEGQTLEDETALFRIYFKKKSNTIHDQDFRITNRITPAVAYNLSGNPMAISASFFQPKELETKNDATLIVYQNTPNPFSQHTKINFKMTIEDLVQVSISDYRGSQVFYSEANFPKGLNQIKVDRKHLPQPGMYYYTITTSTDRVVKKMIVH